MNGFIPAASIAIAALCCSPAQAAQEFSCTGPESLTGKAIGPTTLTIARFECPGAPAPYNASASAPFVVVNFKPPGPAMKMGDTVTVKGHFSMVRDSDHHIDYVVVTDAELAQ